MSKLEAARGRWLDVLVELLDHSGPQMPWDDLCAELGHQLQAPVTGRFHWDKEGRASVEAYPFPDWFDLVDVASRAPALHPLARHYASTLSRAPQSTTLVPYSDDGPARQYRSELAADGIDQHLWIPIELGTADWLVVGACRDRHPFDHEAMELASLAQHVVTAIYRHCTTLSSWTDGPYPEVRMEAATELGLTRRQVVVLSLVSEGLTAAAIGRRLNVSPRTVEQHLHHIYERLRVNDRASAVRRACMAGVL